jgi:hypothetical protein
MKPCRATVFGSFFKKNKRLKKIPRFLISCMYLYGDLGARYPQKSTGFTVFCLAEITVHSFLRKFWGQRVLTFKKLQDTG